MRTQPTLDGAKTPILNYFSVTNLNNPPTEVDEVRGYTVNNTIDFGADNTYGFFGALVADGNKNYNFYAAGDAPNYFAGEISAAGASPAAARFTGFI